MFGNVVGMPNDAFNNDENMFDATMKVNENHDPFGIGN